MYGARKDEDPTVLGTPVAPRYPPADGSRQVIGVPIGYAPIRVDAKRIERTRDDMKVRHGISQLVFAGVTVSYGVIRFAMPFRVGHYYYQPNWETVAIQTIASALFLGALALQLLGFLAAGREWRSAMAYATFGYGAAVLAVMLFATIIVIYSPRETCSGPMPCPYYSMAWIDNLFQTSSFLLGTLLFMEGGTYMILANKTGVLHAPMAAGSVAVMGGAFVCVYFIAPIGFFLTAAASVIAGTVWIVYSQED